MSIDNRMEMGELSGWLLEHFLEISEDATQLFEVDVDKDELWNLYLDSFPAGTNEIYRERREYDCCGCRQFVKKFGNVVVIKNHKVHTIWGFDTHEEELGYSPVVFQPVYDALDTYIKAHAVFDVFVTKEKMIGVRENFELLANGESKKWEHLSIVLPAKFVDHSSKTEDTIKAGYRDRKQVFKRSLEEISEDSIEAVLELIAQKSLYKGDEWETVLKQFLKLKKEYEKLSAEEKEYYAWEKSVTAGEALGRIRNHSMGTFLTDLTEGMDLELALKKYEKIVAPSNYKRPKAVFTQKMLADAQRTLEEMDYMDSLPRRFAVLDDITINDILFSNRDASRRIKGAMDIFGDMAKQASDAPKKFTKAEEIPYERFISDVLPTAREVELYLENKHAGNMVSLIAPVNKDAKSMFKWGNNFGWAYAGNVTDSMRERVKAAGGDVDGVLRFSIQWNTSGLDRSDEDAHCIEPNGNHIFFGNCRKPSRSVYGGQLDVDIINPGNNIAVENITWPSVDKMKPGVYKFFVNQYTARGSRDFSAEIEFGGTIYSFEYHHSMRTGENVEVAEVTLHTDGTFSIKEKLPSTVSSKEVWNLKTNEFVPVNVICYSPNHWDGCDAIGHKHVFFMLKDCINDETPNGFFNEYLKQELAEHKRVFEALGSRMSVEHSNDQLSGVGFSTTKRGDVIVKVKGATERILKIKF